MKTSDIREELDQIILSLSYIPGTDRNVSRLKAIRAELGHRPPVRRAPTTSVPMTPELRSELIRAAVDCPDLTYAEIGTLYNVNGARVSEALAGKRQ